MELIDVAVAAAREAGPILLEGLGRARAIETKSTATDMVSEMDRAAERAIRTVIAAHRPGDAILGEEGGEAPGSTGVRWIVDPLDGTTNYLYGFPAWAVSVAAEEGGAVVAGAVLDPVHDELWTAVAGGGAALNGRPLPRRAGDVPLERALVATGFAYAAEHRAVQGAVIATVLPRVRDIRRAGSAALDLCWVAAGRVDAYFETGTHVWDWAAGALVAREAGVVVSGIDAPAPSEAGLLAAPAGLAEALRALVAGGAGRT